MAPLRLEALAVRRGLRGADAEVVRTGMGRAKACTVAETLWLRATKSDCGRAVAVAGVCGGVEPELRAGDVVVATAVRTEDGVERVLPGAAVLANAVRKRGLRCVTGTILSVGDRKSVV